MEQQYPAMAFLRKRKGSKFWYLSFVDSESGERKEESTRLRYDDPVQDMTARRLREKKTKQENEGPPNRKGDFKTWVPDFIAANYPNEHTRDRMDYAWDALAIWLTERKLYHPRMIGPGTVADYLAWRSRSGADESHRRGA